MKKYHTYHIRYEEGPKKEHFIGFGVFLGYLGPELAKGYEKTKGEKLGFFDTKPKELIKKRSLGFPVFPISCITTFLNK